MTRIAICAPATPITRELAAAVEGLAAAEFPGLQLRFHEQCFLEAGHFAGSDEVRLSALLECANDRSVDAVWIARGGYGSNRIAEAAVAQMGDAAREKTFVGYSDAGFLLAALYRAGIGWPVHAPMPIDLRREDGAAAVHRTLAYLAGDLDGLEPSLDGQPAVAFNLMTLATLTGTCLMPDLSGHVVLVEEVSEHLYAIDRLFFHVTSTLPNIAGLKLGRVSDVPENDRPFGSDVEDIVRFWCGRANIPYLGRADIGHDIANRIVPFGLASEGRRF